MFAIYNSNRIAVNKGGPQGYLYHLKKGLDAIGCDVTILDDDHGRTDGVKKESVVKKNKNQFVEECKEIIHFLKRGYRLNKKSSNNWNEYEVLHVHSTEDVFYLKKIFGYKGQIILTSHKPESLADEKIGALNLRCYTGWKCKLLRAFYNYVEKEGYKTANAFIFPSEHAEKIYYSFPGYQKYSKGKPIEFVYTGCSEKEITLDREAYRKKHSLRSDDYVISYIGRHNHIKGYDLLTKVGEQLNREDISVVCAGALSSIEYPKNEKWIELGYISDAQNLINASDVVIIPNRNTYFDLVIIEILSLGKIVITSKTGGNIDIANYTSGLVVFEAGDDTSLLETILKVKNMDRTKLREMEIENETFYRKYCSIEAFATNYKTAVQKLLDSMGARCTI